MNEEILAREIELLLIKAVTELGYSVSIFQNSLYNDLVSSLRSLEVVDGMIVQNATNRKILAESQRKFNSILRNSNYLDSINSSMNAIDKVDNLNTLYYRTISTSFKGNAAFLKSIRKNAIDTVNSLLLNDGLYAEVNVPLNSLLTKNINSGSSFSGMLEELRLFIKGDQTREGVMMRYSKGILRDTLFNYTRAFQNAATNDLGLVWYRYVGGIIDTTRLFCKERAGGYFHRDEIMTWPDLQWSGKNPYTTQSSIFEFLGGYNCTHQLIAVVESIVPQEWKDRFKL